MLREVLALKRKLHGEEHPDVARNLARLSRLLADKGESRAALSLARSALPMLRKFLGERHPVIAETLVMMGEVLSRTGDFDEAEKAFRDALEMRRALYDDGHPDVARSVRALGNFFTQGDFAQAAKLFRDSLSDRKNFTVTSTPTGKNADRWWNGSGRPRSARSASASRGRACSRPTR